MRLCIVFYKQNNKITLPLHYNYILQSFIYKHLPRELSDKLHKEGYVYKSRQFRLFVFSRLFGSPKIKDNFICFNERARLYIASPIELFIESLAENLLKKPDVLIGKNKLIVESIEVCEKPTFPLNVYVKMLSPITIYSTLSKPDGKKKTYYYTPWEDEFSLLIRENLTKKYYAFYKERPKDTEFLIKPHKVSKNQEKIINYKGLWIKCWFGEYEIKASRELLEFSWDCGLGAKNSQGFGMFDIIK